MLQLNCDQSMDGFYLSLENNSTEPGTKLVWKDFTCGFIEYKSKQRLYHEGFWVQGPMQSGRWNCNETITSAEQW